jgi:hypothetical protein
MQRIKAILRRSPLMKRLANSTISEVLVEPFDTKLRLSHCVMRLASRSDFLRAASIRRCSREVWSAVQRPERNFVW